MVVLLEDTLTKVEQTLAEKDGRDLVREIRRCFAEAMSEPLAALIEEETGHKVHAVMADYSVTPDYAISVFLLESEPTAASDGGSISLERPDDDGESSARRRAISDGIVALFKEYVGRGPRQTRTYIDDDLVVVLLSDALTKAEQTLAEEDRTSSVSEIRREFQAAMKPKMIELVEGTLGRSVTAMLSDHCVPEDYGIEAFVLEPTADAA